MQLEIYMALQEAGINNDKATRVAIAISEYIEARFKWNEQKQAANKIINFKR